MTAKEGLARLRAVRAGLGDPLTWPRAVASGSLNRGCIVQRAAHGAAMGSLGISAGHLWDIIACYDSRDPVALDAALDALEREIDAQGATP